MLTLLGIPNCDTLRKARRFLEQRDVAFRFRDVRREPLSEAEWRNLVRQDGEGRLINTRAPSFRKVGIPVSGLDEDRKVAVLIAQPTAMKRPVVLCGGKLMAIGFSERVFAGFGVDS